MLQTPLHCAARESRVGVVKLLLMARADKDAKDSSETTPLHLASLGGHVARGVVWEHLLLSMFGKRALQKRSLDHKTDQVEIVDLLVEAGAAMSLRNGQGRMALHSAAEVGQAEVIPVLLEVGLLLRGY